MDCLSRAVHLQQAADFTVGPLRLFAHERLDAHPHPPLTCRAADLTGASLRLIALYRDLTADSTSRTMHMYTQLYMPPSH